MEDSHFALAHLGGDWADTAAFAVFDGHGGREVACFCQQRLPVVIGKQPRARPTAALRKAFESMDELLRVPEEQSFLRSFTGTTRGGNTLREAGRVGCTAVVCLVQSKQLVVANAGDSRVVLSRGGVAIPLSEDHKPNLPAERVRIQRAGGNVDRQQIGNFIQYRVNGNLNLSRTIGDLDYKRNLSLPMSEQLISSTPDVMLFDRTEDDEFLLLACDGIWEAISSQDAVDFIKERLRGVSGAKAPLSTIMEELLDHCFAPDLISSGGIGGDNMTALLVLLQPGTCRPYPEVQSSQASQFSSSGTASWCSCR
ncbi:unnamed protein product [Symbiodinium pilosum]|uniref:protein-serine/threonine phosphatase n=1 Tax=Symbiodinium pilosum TaxID=2952 RepID=A0A812KWS0_SYMPI|nr:unnamed protein product [Symbiodinium pilosum]